MVTTVDNLTDIIEKEIKNYSDKTLKDIETQLDVTADSILKYIATNAPRSGSKNAMADDFVKSSKGSGISKTITIHAKTKGSITHLIEFGFMHKSGSYVGPRPFLRPAFDALTPKMISDIRNIISGK